MDRKKLEVYFFGALLLGVLFLTFLIFLPYLSSILFATALAIVFHPIYEKLVRIFKGKTTLAAFSTIVLIFLLILIPLALFGIQIFQESQALYSRIADKEITPDALENLLTPLEMRIQTFAPGFSINLEGYGQEVLAWVAQNFARIFSGIARFVLVASLGLFALYYLLKDGKKLKQKVIELSPLDNEQDEEIFAKLGATVHSVIRGSLAIAFLQGVLTGIGFALFGIPNPSLWGGFAFLAALVPGLGTILVLIPGVLFLAWSGHELSAIGLGIWGATAVGLIDNFLGPRLIKRGLPVHPFLILLSVLGGLNLFGLIGFLLGPLVLSLLFTLLNVYQKEFRN